MPHNQVGNNQRAMNNVNNMLQLPVAANVVPSSPIIVTLIMEAIYSSETRFF
jgi:hypothetical protein